MASSTVFNQIAETNTAADFFFRGSQREMEIKLLQTTLNRIGFGAELNWDKYQDDGDYGGSTTTAVRAFATKNGFENIDGTIVTPSMLEKMLELDEVVDSLKAINGLVRNSKIITSESDKPTVNALQKILLSLGYGELLQLENDEPDGDFGENTASAVKAFCEKETFEATENISVTPEMLQRMIDFYKDRLGNGWNTIKKIVKSIRKLKVTRRDSRRYSVTDGNVKINLRKHKKGYYNSGTQNISDFITNNRAFLEERELSNSMINIIHSISENEGKLDAVNNWDDAYMSFGIFQWTIGVDNGSGELPALLKKIKEGNPEIFHEYYGAYGLDVSEKTNTTYGYLLLNGSRINRTSEKQQFRTPNWAFVFRYAGFNPIIQAFEIEHAVSRLKNFYWRKSDALGGFALSDLITSEYGVALLLDYNVNRPAYVVPCVGEALKRTGLKNPETWTTAEETQLIKELLKRRDTYGKYPMTHSDKRAERTKKYVTDNIISIARGTFIVTKETDNEEEVTARGGQATPKKPVFNQNDYPEFKKEIPLRRFEEEEL